MARLRPSYTEQQTVIDAVGSFIPKEILDQICAYPPRPMYGSFDLTRELHVACLTDNLDRVTDLLRLGADRESVNHAGLNALNVADFLHRVEVVKRLMVDVDIEQAGVMQLLYAIQRRQSTVVQALLEMGVKDHMDEDLHRGVFLIACSFGNTFVVDALVKYGPGICVSPLENMFVQVAMATKNVAVAARVGEMAEEERWRIAAEAEKYMVPEGAIDGMDNIGDLLSDFLDNVETMDFENGYWEKNAHNAQSHDEALRYV
ncbi:hypothetical protein BJX96DRAFT_171520 [Aspergillus floccosus]